LEAKDLLHDGNKESDLFESHEKARNAYNDLLIRYVGSFARMIAKNYRNNDHVENLLRTLPDDQFFEKLQKDVQTFQTMQNQFKQHFSAMNRTLTNTIETHHILES